MTRVIFHLNRVRVSKITKMNGENVVICRCTATSEIYCYVAFFYWMLKFHYSGALLSGESQQCFGLWKEMSSLTNFCLAEPAGPWQKLNSDRLSFSNSDCLSFCRSCKLLAPVRLSRRSESFRMAASVSLKETAASAVGAPKNDVEASATVTVGTNDLLIVGPGVLGRIVAEKWREAHPDCQIYGQTQTTNHHDELIKIGISPSLKGKLATHKFPYVIFCAPPSGSSDYPGEVREATLNWNGEGSFLFTSSSAPYDCSDNGCCDEDTPVVPIGRNPRTDNLLKAEKVVLEAGGCVVRLAGLYTAGRGAHKYWLDKGTVDVRPDHILNLIHYEDAASLSLTILKKNLRGRIFLGCDNHPLSRLEVMELVNKSGKYSKKFEGFKGTSDPLGKKLNNSKTRAELGWEPKYASFAEFLESL